MLHLKVAKQKLYDGIIAVEEDEEKKAMQQEGSKANDSMESSRKDLPSASGRGW